MSAYSKAIAAAVLSALVTALGTLTTTNVDGLHTAILTALVAVLTTMGTYFAPANDDGGADDPTDEYGVRLAATDGVPTVDPSDLVRPDQPPATPTFPIA